jgi:exodeoxyribonuclease VII small subunit
MADTADPAPDPAGDTDTDVTSLGYEQARDELVDIVARLENGQAGLEESMLLWERAEALAAHCSRWLDRAEERLATPDPDA